jgi:uncharacterized membrane protein
VLFRSELDVTQRVAVSAGLSIALAALLGLALYFTPWNAHPTGTGLTLSMTVTLLSTIAILRRWRLSANQPPEGSGPR